MNIGRDNYESYFMDYLDGKLDTVQVEVLMSFLEFNPDLKQELEGLENVSPDVFLNYTVKHRACRSCFYHCDHFYKWQDVQGPGLEYESISAFGPRVGCTDWPTILLANNFANQYGLDVCSTGGAIGLAMDLYERGILTRRDTDDRAPHLVLHRAQEVIVLTS